MKTTTKAVKKVSAKVAPVNAMAAMIASDAVAKKITAQDKAATKPRVTRAPSKKAVSKVTAPVATIKTKAVKFAITHTIQDYARPNAGRQLFAFTQAWLELSGLIKGAAVDEKLLATVAGHTALPYHRKQGNIEMTTKGYALTAKGKAAFAERGVKGLYDAATVEVYKGIMTSGKADGRIVKSLREIVKIAA